ncbi:MAG: Filamentation induced by cAMP protein Fic [Candidatus Giovannonibacteria bacterium GW2011_GWA2_53_7]|uniref:Filamentation induced by cAMP protein Fic n=1 Tax=Candidatus Giovannonibacteria bacterium GW2011_GWA2_53_7 TaxID=1618650 RepID=A0A0G1Y023_9BACT|nr:MAG: Filamentation induced by cAMP protein Fic [Candidatus Giovannonibacteria bacterium GW2011_GWA2_53_7]
MKKKEKRIAHVSQRIWSLINQIDHFRGQWIGGAKLNPQALGRLKRSVLVTSSAASTRIEGAALSDEDVEKIMRGISVQKFKDRDKQEVQGYFELLSTVFDVWKQIPFNESMIKHSHKELLKYVDKDERHRGEYKRIENNVEMFDESGKSLGVVFKTTPAYLTPKQMQELVEWTAWALDESEYHPLLIIGNFLLIFLAIHPFQDGNGRLSRILTNLLLLKTGYAYAPYVSHEKLVEDSKAEYYVALRKSQLTLGTEREDIEPWLEFFLTVSLEQARQAIELLSHENIEKILSPKQLAVWRYLETAEEATAGDVAKATTVARPTVSQAVEVLLRLKKIERIGQGRTTRYRKV